jgi:alanine dehydrogenase
MNPDEVLFLSARDVTRLLSIDECTAAVERAFRLQGEGKTLPPAVLSLHVTEGGFHIKAGVLSLTRNYFAAKINGNFPHNPERFALPTIQGVVVLCDAENGSPLAIVDSREITTLRTAAATAVAAKYLARPNSRTVTVCGCGAQARMQLAAISRMFPVTAALAYDKNPERSRAFASECRAELNIPVAAANELADCLHRGDICVTCTTSHDPFVLEDDIRPGVFIAAVGADNPHKQEIHPTVMARGRIVCDVIQQCATMGDLHHALEAGVVGLEDVHAELGEVVSGRKPGRESAEEIIIFDSTGMALQDVAATALVYEKAVREKTGHPIASEDSTLLREKGVDLWIFSAFRAR